MAKKDSSPDWFARSVAALGIILSIVGLGLTYHNYRWQREIYQENLAERILIRLGASRTMNYKSFSFNPKGEVGVEVVNIGLRPLYIKRVDMRTGNRIFTFYQHDPLKTNVSEHPLIDWRESDPKEDIEVEVETTTKTFSFPHQTMNWVYMSMPIPRR